MSGRYENKHFISKPMNNAARERSRVQSLRAAFLDLQRTLPSVPPDTKLSKLDVLVLSTAYIYHLTQTLDGHSQDLTSYKHSTSQQTTNFNKSTASCSRIATTSTTTANTNNFFQSSGFLIKSTTHREPYSSLTSNSNQNSQSVSCIDDDYAPMTKIGMKTQCLESKEQCRYPNVIRRRVVVKNKDNDSDRYTTSSTSSSSSSSAVLPLEYKSSLGSSSRIRQGRQLQLKPKLLTNRDGSVGILHPVKKWPMRYRLYDKILGQQQTQSTLELWKTQERDCL